MDHLYEHLENICAYSTPRERSRVAAVNRSSWRRANDVQQQRCLKLHPAFFWTLYWQAAHRNTPIHWVQLWSEFNSGEGLRIVALDNNLLNVDALVDVGHFTVLKLHVCDIAPGDIDDYTDQITDFVRSLGTHSCLSALYITAPADWIEALDKYVLQTGESILANLHYLNIENTSSSLVPLGMLRTLQSAVNLRFDRVGIDAGDLYACRFIQNIHCMNCYVKGCEQMSNIGMHVQVLSQNNHGCYTGSWETAAASGARVKRNYLAQRRIKPTNLGHTSSSRTVIVRSDP